MLTIKCWKKQQPGTKLDKFNYLKSTYIFLQLSTFSITNKHKICLYLKK